MKKKTVSLQAATDAIEALVKQLEAIEVDDEKVNRKVKGLAAQLHGTAALLKSQCADPGGNPVYEFPNP